MAYGGIHKWTPPRKVGGIPRVSTTFTLGVENGRGRRGTGRRRLARDTKLSGRERGQEKKRFPCSADHELDWQPYPVDTLID